VNLLNALRFSVSKRILLFEAAIVWTIAGIILLLRGSSMLEASSGFSWLKMIACIGCGIGFFVLVFSKISGKHIARITNLKGNHHRFYEFFNPRSYLMMAGMISLGIFLRKTSIVPLAFLSLAYITMGIPLLFSSFRFYYSWFCYLSAADLPIN
jgi:hypothetical protein